MSKERSIPVSRPQHTVCKTCDACEHAIQIATREGPSATEIHLYCDGQTLEARAIQSTGPSSHAVFEGKWNVTDTCLKPQEHVHF